MTTQTPTETRELVREHYGEVAKTDGACGCGPGCCGSSATTSTDLPFEKVKWSWTWGAAAVSTGAPAIDDLRANLEAAGFAGIHIEINEAILVHQGLESGLRRGKLRRVCGNPGDSTGG